MLITTSCVTMRKFEFVSTSTPSGGTCLTAADRAKIRSRAARNDPFAEELVRPKNGGKRIKKPREQRAHLVEPQNQRLFQKPGVTLGSTTRPGNVASYFDLSAVPASQIEHHCFGTDTSSTPDSSLDSPLNSSPRSSSNELIRLVEFDEDADSPKPSSEEAKQASEDVNLRRQDPLNTCVLPLRQPISPSSGDPFWTFPIKYRACLPILLHYNINYLAPAVPGANISHESLIKAWFSVSIDESAHLYSSLAFAAAHLRDAGGNHISQEDILYLKHSAITEVNRALKQPERAISCGVIGAVMILAAYEFGFGDTDSYITHVAGGRRMIALRGGMQTIDPW